MPRRIPADVERSLRTDQLHIRSSTARIGWSRYAYNQMQARIRASIILIERAGVKWPTKPPILPVTEGTSPRRSSGNQASASARAAVQQAEQGADERTRAPESG